MAMVEFRIAHDEYDLPYKPIAVLWSNLEN